MSAAGRQTTSSSVGFRQKSLRRDVVQWVDTGPKGDTVFESEPEVDALTRLKEFPLSPFISEGLL